MARSRGFIEGIGMTGSDAMQIVAGAIADELSVAEHDSEARARVWMLIARE